MQGKIASYSRSLKRGFIDGADGSRYTFVPDDWLSPGHPDRLDQVEFEAKGTEATNISLIQKGKRGRGLSTFLFAGLGLVLTGCICISLFAIWTQNDMISFDGAFWRTEYGEALGMLFIIFFLFGWVPVGIFLGIAVHRLVFGKPR